MAVAIAGVTLVSCVAPTPPSNPSAASDIAGVVAAKLRCPDQLPQAIIQLQLLLPVLVPL